MIKNIIAIFSILLLLGLGYYLFSANNAANLDFAVDQTVSEQLVLNSQIFIERQRLLQEVKMDTDFLRDENFRSLQSFELPIPTIPVGRNQIFGSSASVSPAPVSETTF